MRASDRASDCAEATIRFAFVVESVPFNDDFVLFTVPIPQQSCADLQISRLTFDSRFLGRWVLGQFSQLLLRATRHTTLDDLLDPIGQSTNQIGPAMAPWIDTEQAAPFLTQFSNRQVIQFVDLSDDARIARLFPIVQLVPMLSSVSGVTMRSSWDRKKTW